MKENSAHNRRVGIWIRVSTEDQAQGESPERHEARARLYAEAKGWKVIEVFHLEGVSGKSVIEHPECKRMLAEVRSGRIKALIFSKLARLARNTRELLDFADIFRDCDCDLISLQESIDTSTPAGRLFYTMIAAMAQWEREETVDRVKASVVIRAKLGSPLGGPAPFGYEWKDKKLVPHAAERTVRKLMYELFLQHRRKKTVVRLLNDAGHRTRNGSKFTSKTLTRLLQDPTAKGIHRANYTTRDAKMKRWSVKPESEWVMNAIEPLVSEEVWSQCNALIDESLEKQPKRLLKKCVNAFAGLVYCSCGERMAVPSNSPKYICRGCKQKIPIQILEGVYCEEIKRFSLSPDQIIAHLQKTNRALAETEQLLQIQHNERRKVEKEIEGVLKLHQAGQIETEDFGRYHKPLKDRLEQIETDIPRLQAEIDIAKVNGLSAEQVATEARDLSEQWPNLEGESKRKIVEAVTERIEVGKQEIGITFFYLPVCREVAFGARKGWDSNPR